MSRQNSTWGAPRIHGELLTLGIQLGETSAGKYMVRRRMPPSQTWRTFLKNHVKELVSVDFFTVPTIGFQVLYVFLVLAHDRCRVLQFNVWAHPTAEWTPQQPVQAFPWDSAPRYLLRDRDTIYGRDVVEQVKAMGIQVRSPPRPPCQRAYVECMIGSIRRSAWITSLFSIRPRFVEPLLRISITITDPEPIFPWRRTRRSRGWCRRRKWAGHSGASGRRASSALRTSRRLRSGNGSALPPLGTSACSGVVLILPLRNRLNEQTGSIAATKSRFSSFEAPIRFSTSTVAAM